MHLIILLLFSTLTFAQTPDVMSKIDAYKKDNKSCLIVYGIQDQDKSKLFNKLDAGEYLYFSEEGNLLVAWGSKEKSQMNDLRSNKLILDKILDKGFDPNNVHPKFIEQLNLLKELTTKCK